MSVQRHQLPRMQAFYVRERGALGGHGKGFIEMTCARRKAIEDRCKEVLQQKDLNVSQVCGRSSARAARSFDPPFYCSHGDL